MERLRCQHTGFWLPGILPTRGLTQLRNPASKTKMIKSVPFRRSVPAFGCGVPLRRSVPLKGWVLVSSKHVQTIIANACSRRLGSRAGRRPKAQEIPTTRQSRSQPNHPRVGRGGWEVWGCPDGGLRGVFWMSVVCRVCPEIDRECSFLAYHLDLDDA